MRDIEIEDIQAEDLIEIEKLQEEFKKYMINVLGYFEDEADYIISEDFKDPYETPYISQDFIGYTTVDEVEYEVRKCQTDFCACGLFHLAEKEPFEFYMLIDTSTLPDSIVFCYMGARKVYVI